MEKNYKSYTENRIDPNKGNLLHYFGMLITNGLLADEQSQTQLDIKSSHNKQYGKAIPSLA